MATKLLLWLLVILFSFYFAGHVFDLVANIPNWKSGEIADISTYTAFYEKASPKNFFFLLVIGTPVLSLVSLILVWKKGGRLRMFTGIAFLTAVVVTVFTLGFFVPINDYIFSTTEYDPVKLKDLATKWVTMDYLRLFLVGVGMLASILGLDFYLKQHQITT